MDTTRYEELRGRLFGLLIRLEGRLRVGDAREVHELIEVDEYGLALEQMVGTLAETATPIGDDERADMLALAQAMQMDDMVPRALSSCPRREQ